jgi:nucleotide-binding universal stress UspA family protein
MTRSIVVGVSSFDPPLSTVRWAAEQAASRGAHLRFVAALPTEQVRSDAAWRFLGQLAGVVTAGWPYLVVHRELAAGPPAQVLRDAAEHAALLVIGADNRTPFTDATGRLVLGDLLATAPCPLAVVPREERSAAATAPIVVALDGATTSPAALAYGFAAADQTGRPLTVLHCLPSGPDDDLRRADRQWALLALGGLFPSVGVRTEVTGLEPDAALQRFARHAAQLVLGSPGSALFGSVSSALLRRARCPVVVAGARVAAGQRSAVG